ncbi:hypothetical protein EMPG_10249 [Blastomyces silverae]|uniref:Uncharacterized protein n=1 Tax=Blastomyces silverae TaxID=2060906 RepID=A0A0H1B5U5_9EURO|nr:hypothetical protein EMPG_10249 [Blastomyces silverae]
MSAIRTHIDAISAVVGKVIDATESAMTRQQQQQQQDHHQSAEGSQAMSVSEMREVTGKLPPIAFQIARETKELVQRLDQMEIMGSGNHSGHGGGGGGGEGVVGGPIAGWRAAEDHDDDDDFR